MYNPLPAGKSAKSAAQRGAPTWQPLKPLKPVELQNAGFVQENYFRSKASNFALWTVEEQLAAGKIADGTDELVISDSSANGDGEVSGSIDDAGRAEAENDSSKPLSGLDAEALEKIKKRSL